MVLDPTLRFNWIFYAIYTSDTQHSSVVSFVVSLSEVLRRGMWTLFRVENEHCTNVENAKASRDVPLPYKLTEQSSTARLIQSAGEHNSDGDSRPDTNDLDPTTTSSDLGPKLTLSPGDLSPARFGSPEIKPKPGKTPFPNNQPKRDRRGLIPTSEISKLDLDKKQTYQHGASNRSTKSASGRDVDLERQQSANSGTLRFRRRGGSSTEEMAGSPIAHALHRVGTTMRNAHKQDYTRKKPTNMAGEDDSDDDDDDDNDSDQE